MFLHQIVSALQRIEQRQELILGQLQRPEQNRESRPDGDVGSAGARSAREDNWLQSGIDNILAYQVGKQKEEGA